MRVKLALFLLFGLSFTSIGQNEMDIDQERIKLERYYENIANVALSEYYNQGTFLVNCQAEIEPMLIPKDYKLRKDDITPITYLPGLPVIPPYLKPDKKQDTIEVTSYDVAIKLKHLIFSVILDTIYNQNDLDFAKELTGIVTNYDPLRGDIINISHQIFPHKDKQTNKKKVQNIKPTAEPSEFDLENLIMTYLPYIIIFILIIFLIIILFRNKKELKNIRHSITETKPIAEPPAKLELKPLIEISNDDKNFLISSFISNSETLTKIISEEIQEKGDEGITRISKLIKLTDEGLIDLLRNKLDPEVFKVLKSNILNNNYKTDPIDVEYVSMLKNKITNQLLNEKERPVTEYSFEFLNQLSDKQILQLIKDESEEMVSILLTQIAGDRAASIFNKLTANTRVNIFRKMQGIEDIPLSLYKKVATIFSNKAVSIKNMKYVESNGMESIIKTLDALPLEQQEKYISQINEVDLELGSILSKSFIQFDEIDQLEDHLLEQAFKEIPTETIVWALRDTEETITQKVLSFRPKREKALILKELETPIKNESYDKVKQKIENSRKQIIQSIRETQKL